MSHHPKPPETQLSTYEEESITDNVVRQFKHRPAVIAGLTAMTGVLGYGYYRWKTKGVLVSTSMFLMQLRVSAQAAAVGCISIAMVYNMVNRLLDKKSDK